MVAASSVTASGSAREFQSVRPDGASLTFSRVVFTLYVPWMSQQGQCCCAVKVSLRYSGKWSRLDCDRSHPG